MKPSIIEQCLALFVFLNCLVPALPSFSNENHTLMEDYEDEPFLYILGRQRLMQAQYDCFKRMLRSPPYEGEGPYCNRTWDGWMCWDDTPAGVTLTRTCPDYFPDFDVTEQVTKYCDENGVWFKHPEDNGTWSNYSMCNAFTPEKLKNAYILYYLAIVGHSVSLATLVSSLVIFLYFKNLSCNRVTLHKNMFLAYVLNSIIIIVHLVAIVPNGELVRSDPVSCKVLHFIQQYLMACNYFWMLCEGIYLHMLIVSTMFIEQHRLWLYYILGWGFPLVPTVVHAVVRALYFNDNCWMSMDTHLLYIIHAPVMAALVLNFLFLLNIVRVLVTKMRANHEAESRMYLKVVRATLFLMPLLGIQFVIFPWKPSHKVLGRIYEYLMHSLIHFQGFFVACIYCFSNNEVQTTVRRRWAQFLTQWHQRWGTGSFSRPASRAAPPVEEIPVFICHHVPRNEAAVESGSSGGEGTEAHALEIIEQESSA